MVLLGMDGQPLDAIDVSNYDDRLVIRDSTRCRRVPNLPWYQGWRGHQFSLAGDHNRKKQSDNTEGGFWPTTTVSGFGEPGEFEDRDASLVERGRDITTTAETLFRMRL